MSVQLDYFLLGAAICNTFKKTLHTNDHYFIFCGALFVLLQLLKPFSFLLFLLDKNTHNEILLI